MFLAVSVPHSTIEVLTDKCSRKPTRAETDQKTIYDALGIDLAPGGVRKMPDSTATTLFHNYLFGLARNRRHQEAIAPELDQAQALSDQHQQPTRQDLSYRTHKSWSRQRRVVAKAEVLPRARRRSQDA